MIKKLQYNLKETPNIAKEVISFFEEYAIVLFYGEVGAGKTTLINEVCRQLNNGIESSSPTFSIINEYDTKDGVVYHMDLYRLKDLNEAIEIGIDEYIYSGNTCLIEWPQCIESLIFDEKCLAIEITTPSNDIRKITFSDIVVED
jgi:tRNA threonylcarbamoyladenosine biosynthesis protein TsaE